MRDFFQSQFLVFLLPSRRLVWILRSICTIQYLPPPYVAVTRDIFEPSPGHAKRLWRNCGKRPSKIILTGVKFFLRSLFYFCPVMQASKLINTLGWQRWQASRGTWELIDKNYPHTPLCLLTSTSSFSK